MPFNSASSRTSSRTGWPGLGLALCLLLTACTDGGKDVATAPAATPASKQSAHLVEVATLVNDSVAHQVQRTGTLRVLREAKIFNQEEGGIRQVPVHEGDTVKAGDVLVRLDDRILRAELDKAIATRKQAQTNAMRLRKLVARNLVSEETLSRAETDLLVASSEEKLLRTRVGYMTIRAPFSGKVSERLVNGGDVAPKHTHLITLIDPSSLITDVSVSELLLPRLKVGDRAMVSIDALGGQPLPGKILRIYPTVDPVTRRGHLEVLLKPVPAAASAGQFCRVSLVTQPSRRLLAPLAALRRDPLGTFVYRVNGDNRVQRQAVTSGLRLETQVELLSGPPAGTQVVVAGFLGLTENKPVRVIAADQAKAYVEAVPGAKRD